MRRSIERQIALLQQVNLETASEERLERQIRKLLGTGYVSRLLNINHPHLYRSRNNEGWPEFTNVRELWYPPPERIKKRSRVNAISESVFYASDKEDTATLEIRPNLNDTLTVLQCELIDINQKALVTELGIHEYSGRSNPNYGGTPPERDLRQQEFIKREGLSETNPALRKYLVDEFMKIVDAKDDFEYKTTIAISHILMNEPDIVDDDGNPEPNVAIDGLSYPSIAADTLGAKRRAYSRSR